MKNTQYLRFGAAAVLIAGFAFGTSSTSVQAAPTAQQDSVVGVFEVEDTNDTFVVDAHSGRRGQRPGGTLYGQEGDLALPGSIHILERIECLVVEGNRATVVARILTTNNPNTPAGTYEQFSFVDGAATGTPDLVGGGWLGTNDPTCVIDHSDPPAGYTPIGVGDVVITDS